MMTEEHGGNIYTGEQVRLDYSISVNPMGFPETARERAAAALFYAHRYPDPRCRELRKALSGYYGLPAEWFICGNGAAELIYALVRAIKPRKACLPVPGFSEYERALEEQGCRIQYFETKEEENFFLSFEAFAAAAVDSELVFLCNPVNPTGTLYELEPLVRTLLEKGLWVIVDECFLELAGGRSVRPLLSSYERLCVLDGLTKSRAMAGLRLGYVMTSNRELWRKLERQGQPWNVSLIAQEAGAAALTDRNYLEDSLELIAAERRRMETALGERGFKVFPSRANFILFKDVSKKRRDEERREPWPDLGRAFLEQGILIRSCGNFKGLDPYFYRIGLKTEKENTLFLSALDAIIKRRGETEE